MASKPKGATAPRDSADAYAQAEAADRAHCEFLALLDRIKAIPATV